MRVNLEQLQFLDEYGHLCSVGYVHARYLAWQKDVDVSTDLYEQCAYVGDCAVSRLPSAHYLYRRAWLRCATLLTVARYQSRLAGSAQHPVCVADDVSPG